MNRLQIREEILENWVAETDSDFFTGHHQPGDQPRISALLRRSRGGAECGVLLHG